MGIARGAVALLLEESSRRPFRGRIVTLGRQFVFPTAGDIADQFARFRVEPRGRLDRGGGAVDDRRLFDWMGFDEVESLDYSNFEGATRVVDLNRGNLPDGLAGAYDVVFDSGTLEHVFHVPNALRNIASLARTGGRVIFLSPSSNHLDHGFYMFSPTLFYDYFRVNGFRIETCYVVRYFLDGEAALGGLRVRAGPVSRPRHWRSRQPALRRFRGRHAATRCHPGDRSPAGVLCRRCCPVRRFSSGHGRDRPRTAVTPRRAPGGVAAAAGAAPGAGGTVGSPTPAGTAGSAARPALRRTVLTGRRMATEALPYFQPEFRPTTPPPGAGH